MSDKNDSSSSSSSSSVSEKVDSLSSSPLGDKDENLTITDLDLFILAGKMAKLLVENTKTNSDRKKVMSQLATFYQMKLVPLNTVSQGSNQILNHLSQSAQKGQSSVDKSKYAPQSSRGQPPPNPVKKDPEYIKMSSEHQALQQTLRTLTRGNEDHDKVLNRVRELERDMTKFKNERGRNAKLPAGTLPVQSSASSAVSKN